METRLLRCALTFHMTDPGDVALRDSYVDMDAAVDTLIHALRIEVHEAFKDPKPSVDNPHMHAVDLHTDAPGILQVDAGRTRCIRDVGAPVTYARARVASSPRVASSSTPPRREPVPQHDVAARVVSAKERMISRDRKLAARHVASEDASKERERVRGLPNEERQALRASRKAERDAARETRAQGGGAETAAARPRRQRTAPRPRSADEDLEVDHAATMPRRVVAVRSLKGMRVYENAVPFDRHLRALARCDPHPALRPALLEGVASDALRLHYGPPGTGKTHSLVERLRALDGRVVVLHPSNVGCCALYTRIHEAGLRCALVIPKERVSTDTPRFAGRDDAAARVVVCTVSGRGGPRLASESFRHVLVDEAAQVPEYLLWGVLDGAAETLSLGDTRQLPGVTSERGRRLGLGVSLMERLLASGYPAVHARTQRRMHPEIVSFPNRSFYDGALLTDHTPLPDMPRAYEYVLVDGEEARVGTSYRNDAEVEAVARAVRDLRAQGCSDIVVVTGYTTQVVALSSALDVVVATTDSFQGREADVVLLSLVRTSSPGFWSDARRLNVALTRAKHVLRGFGSSHEEGILARLREDAEKRGLLSALDTRCRAV